MEQSDFYGIIHLNLKSCKTDIEEIWCIRFANMYLSSFEKNVAYLVIGGVLVIFAVYFYITSENPAEEEIFSSNPDPTVIQDIIEN